METKLIIGTDAKELKKADEEYNKPENKLKRKRTKLGLQLNHFTCGFHYPYIKESLYYFRLNYTRAIQLDDDDLPYLNKALQGASEKILYNRLVKKFGVSKIKTGNYSVAGFFPDIIYVDETTKTFIDIEIDEPYSYKNRQPIHFTSSTEANGTNVDDCNKERDDAFRKYGWTVIRFSEEQVINQVDECVKIIDYVICYLSANYSLDDLSKSRIRKQKRWTREEAYQLAILNHRSY